MLMIETARYASHGSAPKSVVIFNPATHLYYQLDEIAAFVWKLVRQPMTLNEICSAVQAAYNIEPDACRNDVASLLEELEQVGLIETAAE